MPSARLEQYLRHFFGGVNPNGTRFHAINNAHVVHESGYEVTFGRNSVTYRDGSGVTRIEAELTDVGLLVYSSKCAEQVVVERVKSALTHLGVRQEHQ